MAMIDREKFWDKKILSWEFSRYHSKKATSKSVAARMDRAIHILSSVSQKKILELGCGSGLMASQLKCNFNKFHYLGLDFSKVAINAAQLKEIKGARFQIGSPLSIDESTLKNFDVVFSLGLIDWLNKKELDQLGKISQNKIFLHSFSRHETSFRQFGHSLYTWLFYGFKNKGYVPKYHKDKEILSLFNGKIIQPSGMSFGAFVTNIDRE